MTGSLGVVRTSGQILDKLNIEEGDHQNDEECDIDLTSDEISFLSEMIGHLDTQQKLYVHGLSLYNKILDNKEQ